MKGTLKKIYIYSVLCNSVHTFPRMEKFVEKIIEEVRLADHSGSLGAFKNL